MNPSLEEIRFRKLAALGDVASIREATRLARRRGETRVIVLDDEGNLLDILDPKKNHCDGSPPCGGCDSCLMYFAPILLDCRP